MVSTRNSSSNIASKTVLACEDDALQALDKERVVDAKRASKRKAVGKVKKTNPKKKVKGKKKPLSPNNTPPCSPERVDSALVAKGIDLDAVEFPTFPAPPPPPSKLSVSAPPFVPNRGNGKTTLSLELLAQAAKIAGVARVSTETLGATEAEDERSTFDREVREAEGVISVSPGAPSPHLRPASGESPLLPRRMFLADGPGLGRAVSRREPPKKFFAPPAPPQARSVYTDQQMSCAPLPAARLHSSILEAHPEALERWGAPDAHVPPQTTASLCRRGSTRR